MSVRPILMSVAVVAGFVAIPVRAQPAVPELAVSNGWRRVVSLDGLAAVRVPCDESGISRREREGTYGGFACVDKGLGFGLVEGRLPGPRGGLEDFDDFLADMRNDKSAGVVTLTSLSGHRAFTVISNPEDTVSATTFVEMARGHLLLAMAHEKPVGAITADHKAEARARARAYVESLEILAK
jgi:hypothetical protein